MSFVQSSKLQAAMREEASLNSRYLQTTEAPDDANSHVSFDLPFGQPLLRNQPLQFVEHTVV